MSIIPWARAEESVKEGSVDILPNMWFTKEREKSFLYGEPYLTKEVKFIKRKGDNFEYDGINSLSGKKLEPSSVTAMEMIFYQHRHFPKTLP